MECLDTLCWIFPSLMTFARSYWFLPIVRYLFLAVDQVIAKWSCLLYCQGHRRYAVSWTNTARITYSWTYSIWQFVVINLGRQVGTEVLLMQYGV
jgi:hypothetical protein